MGGDAMVFDRDKLEASVLYICGKCEQSRLGAVKLHKVLYFADMLRYADTGSSITGSTYKKRPLGPTCEQLLPILSSLQRNGSVEIQTVDYFGYAKKQYVAKLPVDTNRLSVDELRLLDEVIDFVCYSNSAKTISEYSHNRAWELADFGEELKYNSVFLIFPSEMSSETMDWAETEVKRLASEKPKGGALDRPDFGLLRARILETVQH
jgi:hypothetical protein